MLDLASIRQRICAQRKNLSPTRRQEASLQIAQQLQEITIFQEADHIAAYLPIHGECDPTALIIAAWQHHKSCYLPCVLNGKHLHLEFRYYTLKTRLSANRYHILEPKTAPLVSLQTLDVVLVPLVAFDSDCHRIGMGGGFYDRTFSGKIAAAKHKKKQWPYLIGLAYEFQRVEDIIPQPWDVDLDIVITEQKIYYSHSNPFP